MDAPDIQNDGSEIGSTTYWTTDHARRGDFYLSLHGGTFRLLVPPSKEGEIGEWRSAVEVIISRGPWPQIGKSDGVEILFEDRSDSPYSILLKRDAADHLPQDAERDQPGEPPRWRFAVWTRSGKVLDLSCRYRTVKRIPWLKAWEESPAVSERPAGGPKTA
jgi:hypothetical protein